MNKTVVFAVHVKPLVEKTSHNTVFSTHSQKSSVNSDVLEDVGPLTLQKHRKSQRVFF